MQIYDNKIEVPWKDVLNSLHWALDFRLLGYEITRHHVERGDESLQALRIEKEDICTAYQNYHAVRLFLGYRRPTVLESKALAVLRDEG